MGSGEPGSGPQAHRAKSQSRAQQPPPASHIPLRAPRLPFAGVLCHCPWLGPGLFPQSLQTAAPPWALVLAWGPRGDCSSHSLPVCALTVLRGPLNWYRNVERNWKWGLRGTGRKVSAVPAPSLVAVDGLGIGAGSVLGRVLHPFPPSSGTGLLSQASSEVTSPCRASPGMSR